MSAIHCKLLVISLCLALSFYQLLTSPITILQTTPIETIEQLTRLSYYPLSLARIGHILEQRPELNFYYHFTERLFSFLHLSSVTQIIFLIPLFGFICLLHHRHFLTATTLLLPLFSAILTYPHSNNLFLYPSILLSSLYGLKTIFKK